MVSEPSLSQYGVVRGRTKRKLVGMWRPGTDEGGEWSPVQKGMDKERLLAGFEWKGHMDESNIHRNERDLETV